MTFSIHYNCYLISLIICVTTHESKHRMECWNLVWLHDRGWEEDYIPNQLLKNICLKSNVLRRNINENFTEQFQNNTIIVSRTLYSLVEVEKTIKFIEMFKRSNVLAFILILIGDECQPDTKKCSGTYERLYLDVPLVIRNFWTHDCSMRPNVLQAPLGIATAMGSSPISFQRVIAEAAPFHVRNFVWSFASGRATDLRGQFIDHLMLFQKKYPEYNYYLSYKGYRKQKPVNMSNILERSIFGACPEGVVADTWRFYETMERGAIPIINSTTLRNYYQNFIPCNITTNLLASENPEVDMAILMRDKRALGEQRNRLLAAYAAWRDDWRDLVARRVYEVALLKEGRKWPTIDTQNRTRSHGLLLNWDFESCSTKP